MKEKDHEYGNTFRIIDLSRKIRFLGRGNLRLKEVLLTYAWAWLFCPVIVVLPEILFVHLMFGVVEGEEDSGWQAILLIFLMGSWPIFSLWVAMYMRTRNSSCSGANSTEVALAAGAVLVAAGYRPYGRRRGIAGEAREAEV